MLSSWHFWLPHGRKLGCFINSYHLFSVNILVFCNICAIITRASAGKPESKNAGCFVLVTKWEVIVPGVPNEERGNWECCVLWRKLWKESCLIRSSHIQTHMPFVVGPHEKMSSVLGTGRSTNSIVNNNSHEITNEPYWWVQTTKTLTKLWLLT